ncbi:recombinase family protein [Blautia coccoides]|uniref:recombinase family protein n=1 Tax=Blautia producta TaxID=33035 RepID=UPI002149BC23|nr:recombinase family protein [Blautia coccoides]MCR1988589.1 recombinase family protein [Blautia coccoides]
MARKSRKQTEIPMPAPSLYVYVALYIRLSVEDNKKRGCSVENQKLVLNDYLADKPDFIVYDTYIDNGLTGTNFHRPGFQQMLSDIEAGHINCVIVKDLSRLGRNSIDTGYYIEQYFYAHNVRFIAVTDQFDTADPGNLHGGIMLPLKNMINEAYSLDIGRKIKAQARQAMKDGDYIGARAPYGYRKDPDNCHKLLLDENTAPVVKQIFDWAYEHMALNRIVRNLNEMGIAAPSHYKKSTGEITSPGLIGSGKWQTRTVMKILESEVYTGDLVQGKTKMVDHQQVKAGEDNLIIAKCTHEPIISHELFTAVQEYRKQVCEESRAKPKNPYTPNIFKGKVFCADCGRSLHRQRAERRKGPDIYWFHCLTNSRVAKDTCKGVMMQETELIATVTAILEKELSVALGMSLPLFQLEARQKQKKDGLKSQMSAKRQEIEKQRRLIRGLYENFVQGILTSEEYFELKAGYEESITVLSGDIEALEKGMDALDDQLVRYRAMEKDAKSLAQDHVLTAELIERLIDRIEIDHERNIRVFFRFKSEFQGEGVK